MSQCKGSPCGSEDPWEGTWDAKWQCMREALPGSSYCKKHRDANRAGMILAALLLVCGLALFTWILYG